MADSAAPAEERYASLVEVLARAPGVTPPSPAGSGKKSFGSDAIKVDNKIFAMMWQGDLVLKLPRQRVEALIGAGTGTPFDAGKGRPMKEWVAVGAESEEWEALAREAMAFVGKKGRGP
jgi:hypothetical protein